MKPGGAIAGFVAGGVLFCGTALGDGLLPPQPYHYLHPPAAFRRSNKPPLTGKKTLALNSGGSVPGVILFTDDGQAGVGTKPGALTLPKPARKASVLIKPVNTPRGLPSNTTADGNAYAISVTGSPGKRPASLHGTAQVILRWPQIPTAMYVYDGKRWSKVCSSSSSDWEIGPTTVLCHARTLGIFVAVRVHRKPG